MIDQNIILLKLSTEAKIKNTITLIECSEGMRKQFELCWLDLFLTQILGTIYVLINEDLQKFN